MILSFHPCFVADHQIILGDRSLNSGYFSLINEARAIILPQSCSADLYQACKKSSAVLFPNYEARYKYPGKVGQSLLFEKIGCPHPETVSWSSVSEFRKAWDRSNPHDMPFLLKADEGHEADNIYPVEDSETLESALKKLLNIEKIQ